MNKEYLGDSVYAEIDTDRGMLVLTTENGLPTDPSNKIYMESDVIEAFIYYCKRHIEGGE